MSDILDARTARSQHGGPSFTRANRLYRLVFMVVWLVAARWTPRPANAWRVWLLRRFGARIAPGAVVYGSARIWSPAHLVMEARACLGPGVEAYAMAPITLGAGAIISQRAVLCAGTHDIRDPAFQLVARPITIGAGAWVAMEAFVGPGVRVGEGAVLGARGVAMRDLAAWTVYAGNPAVALGPRVIAERGTAG